MSTPLPLTEDENDALLDVQDETNQFVTFYLNHQAFGIPVLKVHDILKIETQNKVPLAPKEVSGLINLRGRVVPSISMRRYLNLPELQGAERSMSVVLEHNNDLYNFMVDKVSEVQTIPLKSIETVPPTLDPRWHSIASGVYRLNHELLVILNIDQIFATMGKDVALSKEDTKL